MSGRDIRGLGSVAQKLTSVLAHIISVVCNEVAGDSRGQDDGNQYPERFINYVRDPQYERIPHPSCSGLVAVFKTVAETDDSTTRYTLMYGPEYEKRVVHTAWASDFCTSCDDNDNYSPGMGTPYKTGQRKRKQANCEHANLASKAFRIDTSGACENCGCWGVVTKEYSQGIRGVVLTVEKCAHCGSDALGGWRYKRRPVLNESP